MTFRIGLVGAGYMGSEYVKLLSGRRDFQVTGIVSRTELSARNLARDLDGVMIYKTIGEMYSEAQPDVVIVAVPELETPNVLRQVWRHPWTCIVEKPAGHNMREAEKITQGSCQAEGETFLALNRRYYESVTRARIILAEHSGPRYLHLVDQHDTETAKASGKPTPILNNWHFANAIHTVDLARFIARGEIENVQSSVWQPSKKSFVLDSEIEFSSGDRLKYTSYWNIPQKWSLSVSTPLIRVLLSPLEELSTQQISKGDVAPSQLEGRDLAVKPGLSGLLSELTNYLEGKPHDLVSLDEGLLSMQLVERIFDPVLHVLFQNHLD